MTSYELVIMICELMNKSKEDFLNGIDNGEKKATEFFISELTNTMRSDSILIQPSQCFGVLSLLREKIPDIKSKVRVDYAPTYSDDFFDEGQVWLDLNWQGEFPNTGPIPQCFT